MKISTTELMKSFGFFDWKSIYLGIERGWLNAQDIIDEAIKEVSQKKSCIHIIEIAMSNSNEKERIRNLVKAHLDQEGIQFEDIYYPESKELKKWRLCFLISIMESPLSDEVKLEKIQEVYSEFSFPEDMAASSPYYFSPDELKDINQNNINFSYTDPLEATRKLVVHLKNELKKHSVD